jgi:hypothetical protein
MSSGARLHTRGGRLVAVFAIAWGGVACDGLVESGRAVTGPVSAREAGGAAPVECTPGLASAAACERSRRVLACDVPNARDLGGVPADAGGVVACGALFRGAPLVGLSEAGCAEVARLGVRSVIDLRTESERLSIPDDACVGGALIAAPLPIPYDVSPEDYLADLYTSASIARIFHALGDEASYPVYFHCTYGRDRTGIVAALIYLALGAPRADIMGEYELSRASVGAYPESLAAVLDDVERRGGIEAVLASIGVTGDELGVLRRRALAP